MPTSCLPYDMCDTDATAWINGIHPTVADGQVSRQVCFHWTSSCCEWSTNIKVRNCGSYFVYYLSGTPASVLSVIVELTKQNVQTKGLPYNITL